MSYVDVKNGVMFMVSMLLLVVFDMCCDVLVICWNVLCMGGR